MNHALREGESDLSGKENAPQREPGGINRFSISTPRYIASPPAGKAIEAWRPRRRGRHIDHVDARGVIHESSEFAREDQKARDQLKASASRAAFVLSEMRKLLQWQERRHPAPEEQDVWLEVAIAQFNFIRLSNPRWTLGLHRWVKKYAPQVYRERSMSWVDSRVEDQRREGKFFTPSEIGRMLHVPRAACVAMRFRAIWPDDMTPEEREAERRTRKAAWQRKRNIDQGVVKKPHALSEARLKPWIALEISERTYRRRKARGEL